MDASKTTYRVVPLDKMYVSAGALRPAMRETESYVFLKADIKKNGCWREMLCREEKDGTEQKQLGMDIEICDGQQRFDILTVLGYKEIRVAINNTITDRDIQLLQISLNTQGVNTTKKQISQAMHRAMAETDMTIDDLAALYSRSIAWVENHLNLKNLNDQIAELQSKGTLNATLAFKLGQIKDPQTQIDLCRGNVETQGHSILSMKQGDALNHIANAVKAETDAAKNKEPEFTPRHSFIGKKPLMEAVKAAEAAGDDRFAQGALFSIQADDETEANQRKIWDAGQAEKGRKKLQVKQTQADKKAAKAKQEQEQINQDLANLQDVNA